MNTNRITLISLFATVILPLAACNQMTPTPPSQDAPAETAAPIAAPQTANLTASRYFWSRTFYNTADLRRDNGEFSSIALDSAGNVVIAYYDGVRNDPSDFTGPYGNGDLKLVVCGNPNCINPVVTTVDRGRIYTDDAGRGVSLALDARGFPVISYTERGLGVKLVHCGDVTCTSRNRIQVVDAVRAIEFGNTSLVLDRDGDPVISYGVKNGTSSELRLIRCGNANCDPNAHRSVGMPPGISTRSVDIGLDNALALDMIGNPVISYYDTVHGDLKIAHCYTPDCSERTIGTQIVDSAGDVGRSNSLVLVPVRDVLGQIKEQRPFVSYFDATNGDLKIAYCANTDCSSGRSNSTYIQTLDSQGNVGQMTSLKLASDGSPIISYYDATNQDLKIAYCDPGQPFAKVPTLPCQETQSNVILTLDSVGDAGQNSSLALDANDKPVISYYQATYASLRMIRGQ
jgi:hypothetical protein